MDSIFNALSTLNPFPGGSRISPAKMYAMKTEEMFISGGKRHFRELLRDGRYRDTVISRQTEKTAAAFLNFWEEQTDRLDPSDQDDLAELAELAVAMRQCLSVIRDQIDKDKMFEPARLKLEELTTTLFRLRYGAYLPSYASYTGQEARDLGHNTSLAANTPDDTDEEAWHFFLRERWSSIYARLQAEDVYNTGRETPSALNQSGRAPLVRLLQALASQTGQSAPDAARAIGDYVTRISASSSHPEELVRQGRPYKSMCALQVDLEGLSDPPRACQEDVPAIKAAIRAFARRCFTQF
ncbi:hypothetical protein ACHAPX_004958 [Trichoderma viride]